MQQLGPMVVIERHALYREALAELIRGAWPDAALALFDRPVPGAGRRAAVVLVDLETFSAHGEGDLSAFVRACEEAPVIALADRAIAHEVVHALHAGVRGFIPKTMSRQAIRDAIALVLEGAACFPADAFRELALDSAASVALRCRRELDVLRQLDRGNSNKVIARELGVSVATVKAHVQSILRATQAKNRTEAVANARRLGMLPAH